MHGVIHEKTDVFAFGVLLLELITGQQPINKSQQSLVIWVSKQSTHILSTFLCFVCDAKSLVEPQAFDCLVWCTLYMQQAKPLLESMQIKDLADPRLAGEYDHGEMQAMVKIAAMCVHNSSMCRPLMGQVSL